MEAKVTGNKLALEVKNLTNAKFAYASIYIVKALTSQRETTFQLEKKHVVHSPVIPVSSKTLDIRRIVAHHSLLLHGGVHQRWKTSKSTSIPVEKKSSEKTVR
jgi:hypothetical protein